MYSQSLEYQIAADRKPFYAKLFVFILLTTASLRGAFVLHLHFSPGTVYNFSFLAVMLFSLFGMFQSLRVRVLPRKLIFLIWGNCFFGVIFILSDLVLSFLFGTSSVTTTTSVYFLIFAPFALYLLVGYPDKLFYYVVVVIALLLCYSVITDFFVSLSGKDGLEEVIRKREILRPNFEAIGRVGDFFQAAGYTGDHHDSANILGMITVFTFLHAFVRKKIIFFFVSLLALFALLLTVSASNITIALGIAGVAVLYCVFRQKSITSYIAIIVGITLLLVLFFQFSFFTTIFTKKFSTDSDKAAMLGYLSSETVSESVLAFFFGHSDSFNLAISRSEIAYVKLLFGYGVFHFVFICFFLYYPVMHWFKNGRPLYRLPETAAALFGALSLLHYGSVLRITSFFLFLSFYAMAIKVPEKSTKE